MAVYFTFAASKAHKSVPCLGSSISLKELKDAIAAPLVLALRGKKLREQFDFRVFDSDSKEEIVGANARVRKHASVVVKRVPAYVVSQRIQMGPVVVDRSTSSGVVTECTDVVVDDGFGEDVYSTSSGSGGSREDVGNTGNVTRTSIEHEEVNWAANSRPSTNAVSSGSAGKAAKQGRVRSKVLQRESESEAKVNGGDFRVGISSPCTSAVSSENIGKASKQGRVRSKILESEVKGEAVGDVPTEFLCALCNNIMKVPMLIPCCCNSFCQSCIEDALLGGQKCPKCASVKCRAVDLLLNRHLKSMIEVSLKPTLSAASSGGSCSSQTTSSQPRAIDVHREAPLQNVSLEQMRVPYAGSIGVLGKREPLIISLNGNPKRSRVM